ncbi:hypothetical protein QBC47DRAFT_354527 [Echria macrotheca]|uniref:2EXR domain-containing protein n=1 Tax=Echria macrotheca TaxID=438768 RepID=A0AAJ0B2U6_9PEZI|nr:hypothetical protein QBC47DRAFT_354527 [Echria macrotheca]
MTSAEMCLENLPTAEDPTSLRGPEDSIERKPPATTFHYFLWLPFEIREIIWKFAVRPAVPGAHVFSVWQESCASSQPKEMSSEFPALHPINPANPPTWRLGAPRCLSTTATFTRDVMEATPPSWLRDNPSAYLIDSGLWSACRESRRVLEQAFRRPEHHGKDEWGITKSVMDEEAGDNKNRFWYGKGWNEKGYFALPGVTSFAARAGGESRFFSVMPARDLFILQPSDLSEWLRTGSLPFALGWCDQVALEYDPSWEAVLQEYPGQDIIRDIGDKLLRYVAQENYVETFWIIDYRINLNAIRRTETRQRRGERDSELKVFCGSDRRYVEVCEPHHRSGRGDICGPWDLIHMLWSEWFDEEITNPYTNNLTYNFGVLACEYF